MERSGRRITLSSSKNILISAPHVATAFFALLLRPSATGRNVRVSLLSSAQTPSPNATSVSLISGNRKLRSGGPFRQILVLHPDHAKTPYGLGNLLLDRG